MLQKAVIKSERAFEEVLKYEPQKLISTTVESMDELLRVKELSNDFLISDVVKNFTGLAGLEVKRIESEIEKKALEELKSVQEQAFAEAYELGIAEGKKQAYSDLSEEIEKRLKNLDQLTSSMRDAKIHFLNSNENQLIKMVFYLATKVALFEISNNTEKAVLNVLKECINITHSEEKIKVGVAAEQVDFLETLQKEQNREFDFLRNVEFLPQAGISLGGCVITTNYSEIDARIEERVTKLWAEIQAVIPPLKDQINHG